MTHAPSFRDVFEMLARQWRLLVALYFTIVVTAAVGSFLLTPKYRAYSRVLLSTKRAAVSTDPQKASDIQRAAEVSDAELSSQVEIAASIELVARTLREMGIAPTPHEPGAVERM